jgi:UDP-N-acetylmuramate dehydrogenase
VNLIREIGESHFIIGRGSNLLVADKGFRGLVIENRCQAFKLDAQSRTAHVEAGVSLALLARKTAQIGAAGLEWAIGIPGTVGGAIVSNAGAYGGTVSEVVCRARILDQEGQIRELSIEELELGYRGSRFTERESSGQAILSSDFKLNAESSELVTERMARYDALRRAEQPREPSAGSVFKNPPGVAAARLIDQAELKGRRIGGAQVSPKHANYIVNLGSAKAEDVLGLIDMARQEILRRFDVELELEIELIGEWNKV